MNKPIKQTLLGVLKKLNYYELITRTLVFGLIIAFLRLDNKLNEEETVKNRFACSIQEVIA